MKQFKKVNVDGNTATTHTAYAFSEVAAIYPITPSSDMGEMADAWSARGLKNIFGERVDVIEMQSEGGAAGAIHGALSGGAMATTFTASQGLLLMIPNMFKIAGEMQPTVFHVSARSIAAQSLSIFGDHSDVMACRSTGFAMIASANAQECQDLAAVAHLATLESRVPFLHFFDGFRTSHTIQKIEQIDYGTFREMLDMKYVEDFRNGAMKPEAPYLKVGAQNPDVYFQGRETTNLMYKATPDLVKKYMDVVYKFTGRKYELFKYVGDPNAEKIVIAMGSAADTIEETIDFLTARGEKVGALIVRLYRPFSEEDFRNVIPGSVKKIAVLDRTKEPGAIGEPLYLDTVVALKDRNVHVIGGRYGLSSKEFTPSMVKAVFDHLDNDGWHGFTVGINDDVSNLSIPTHEEIDTEDKSTIRCKFWGYGSDGTVSANKNSIKIIGDGTDKYVQGYFQYDSNKSGGFTVSHLRFGDKPIKSQYLLNNSDFIALHRQQYVGHYDILDGIRKGGTFLINCAWKPEDVFEKLTEDMQKTIKEKDIKVYCVDASKIAKKVGLGNRINTVMQTAFFKLSGVLPEKEAIDMSKQFVEKQFLVKGREIVDMNWKAIDAASDAVQEVPIPEKTDKAGKILDIVPPDSGDFALNVVDPVMRLKGDTVPVSLMSIDGKVPTGTKRLEKRGKPGKAQEWLERLEFTKDAQYKEPYFEYPPACNGCGEVGYLSAATQLFGDRMLIANATGCSSIYGGTFPTSPYTTDSKGYGPSWANSLFEDNAEYGFGMRLAVDANRKQLKTQVEMLLEKGTTPELTAALKKQMEMFKAVTIEAKEHADKVKALIKPALEKANDETKPILEKIDELKDYFINKSIWLVGGDGWAYDIGYGGLDHVMASNKNVNALVMDTEVYSNTGGQASKATPRGAVAKFAASGKPVGKKNLGLMMATYGHTYVAQINMGLDREHAIKCIVEAEEYDGPSIIIAYSPCIAHGYDLVLAKKQSEKAGMSGYWPIWSYNPTKLDNNENPFEWATPEITPEVFDEYTNNEIRYSSLMRFQPERAHKLREEAKIDNERRFHDIKNLGK
jgi:pyruvate-ferredoxin/flavodoxin oxidoreductase